MTKSRQILIECPHYQKMVRGTYETGPDGQYLVADDGSFILDRAACSHNGGVCAQSLCVLHRYNRRGDGSWHPTRLVPTGRPKRRQRPGRSQDHQREGGPGTDLLC